jgi:glutamine synthetase
MGGDTVAWGTDHRSVPLRKIKAGHWEIRVVDATANMYLALAAFISAGLLGIQHDDQLHWKDASMSEQNGEPLRLKDASMRENGITTTSPTTHKLPISFLDALTLLYSNFDDIEAVMGSTIIRHYLSLKRSELAQLQSLSPNTVRDLFVELF